MQSFTIRPMLHDDWNEVAGLIHASLNAWYLKNRGFELVAGPQETMRIFPRVYEALDPGCCLLAVEDATGRIAGSCFYHPRATHISLGIMNVHPDYFGKKIAGKILREICQIADDAQKPLRLVSSAMNLDSFSLYNRYDFVPTIFFQDMIVEIPTSGFPVEPPPNTLLRDAVAADIPAIAALEKELYSIDREKDWRFFFDNTENIWGLSVLESTTDGKLLGAVASVSDPGSKMVGPGIARTEEGAAALIRHELNRYPGEKFVWLIPSNALKLRADMFALGAVNCETHIGQVRGEYTPATGVVLPSFMPETS